ncbi:centriole, cilia and spindle-associated protein [Triplophysa dalaica]|uniref:centriole, cilia and spindle-associated protein n=1 Tax=Triplophysa dalaica TaxID=1582913 RepID=UPI0024DF7974|nr:centriole, cilia and spindle-associated protein [Triplophysa dalaica]XP_056616645.1 centriole, cilia and spindle-associated protein [Triplophysa dalaica]
MVTKRIRSEYMKRFKDPKWDTYAKCYEDLLKYRLSRRLLEQAHNPWFWGEWGSETESSGKSSPLSRNKVEPQVELPAAEPDPIQDTITRDAEQNNQVVEEEKSRVCSPALIPETDTRIKNTPKPKCLSSHKSTRSKVKPHAIKDTDKENRHPFALYGGGEKQTDMASRKTHNVGPEASTAEIHESALRAKTRRELEKQMRGVDKQRAKSADLETSRNKIVPDYNPWMTEYMSCFSARSR